MHMIYKIEQKHFNEQKKRIRAFKRNLISDDTECMAPRKQVCKNIKTEIKIVVRYGPKSLPVTSITLPFPLI